MGHRSCGPDRGGVSLVESSTFPHPLGPVRLLVRRMQVGAGLGPADAGAGSGLVGGGTLLGF